VTTRTDPVIDLLTPEAVRSRCEAVFDLAATGLTQHFDVDLSRIDVAARLVVSEIHNNYPGGKVPLHSRWRHFGFEGHDLWEEALAQIPSMSPEALARARFDLAIISVLLDAGAGGAWRYRDSATGLSVGRSEGLALASLRMFLSGAFSCDPLSDPLRVDSQVLEALTPEALGDAFQITPRNPMPGVEHRALLLNNLGRALSSAPNVFERDGSVRPGHLYDYLSAQCGEVGALPARAILIAVLRHLGAAWPSARRVGEVAIADIGELPILEQAGIPDRFVPFHKLSQWLTYSLIEPLQQSGILVCDLDDLTGLAEYRNGGLFIDTGVLRFKDQSARQSPHQPTDPLIVEWRALTIALLDRIAARVREMTGKDAASLPLGAVLQGGTWSAGRRIASDLRADGGPPLTIISDGTLF
jgi:hypothetical protein